MEHKCTAECDLVIALTDKEAETHRLAGDVVKGSPGHQYLVVIRYAHLPAFSIR